MENIPADAMISPMFSYIVVGLMTIYCIYMEFFAPSEIRSFMRWLLITILIFWVQVFKEMFDAISKD